MKRLNITHLLLLLLLLFIIKPSNAQVILNDSARVSLLTASPWHGAVYSLFGHTAIRVQDDSVGVDDVFNYGYFDPSQPHFVYNFIRGKTDYILGVDSYNDFYNEYSYKGQRITEQTLNLSITEKQELYEALYFNAQPENRRYRYNYFYDNCATRPRDMIEKYSDSTILYPATTKEQTYRDLLHECMSDYPWIKFGVDLMIGSDADKVIGVREKMYIPYYLMESFEGAILQRNDTLSIPLVKNSQITLELNNERNNSGERTIFTPVVIAFAILLITIFISILQVMKLNIGLLPRIYDTVIFSVAGIAGVIIFVLMCFSEHPATNPNWNFVWINIVSLIAAILFWVNSAKNIVYLYHFTNFVVLTLFILLWWLIPQQLPIATIPFSLSLWVRSGANIFMLRKKRIRNSRFTSSRHMKAGWGQ